MMNTDALNNLDIFSTLSTEEMARVCLLMKRRTVSANSILFKEGDKGRHMYIVLSGAITISIRTDDGRDVEISRVEEGSFFGEMSILEKNLRSATCRALEDCDLLSLDAEGFMTLMESTPNAAIKIMNYMLNTGTSRLQNTGAFLSDMVKWGESARIRAVTDEFTGLYNRRFFDGALKDMVRESKMSGKPMCLIMVDLDRFGTLNAEYGEAVGDQVILSAIPAFINAYRDGDILARYGGDEFAFILPNTQGEAALECSRRAGEALRKLSVLDGLGGSFKRVTASMGIAVCPDHAKTPKKLLEWADKALYTAKEAGRDGAVLYRA